MPMAATSQRKCWNGPSCPWRARGVCLSGHEHDGPQTWVAPIDTVSREELDRYGRRSPGWRLPSCGTMGNALIMERRRLSASSFPKTGGQQREVKQVVEVSAILKKAEIFFDFPEPQMTEQLVNVPEILIEVATPSSEPEPFATTHTGAQDLGNADIGNKNPEPAAGTIHGSTSRRSPCPLPRLLRRCR